MIGLIENSIANSPHADAPRTSQEPNLQAPSPNPSVATEGTSNATGVSSGGAEGPKNPAVQVVPFQSLP